MNEGTRVRFVCEVWRYPHFIVPSGAVGTVVEWDEEIVRVRMEEDLGPGAAEWNNEVHWYAQADDDPAHDIAAIGDDLEVLS